MEGSVSVVSGNRTVTLPGKDGVFLPDFSPPKTPKEKMKLIYEGMVGSDDRFDEWWGHIEGLAKRGGLTRDAWVESFEKHSPRGRSRFISFSTWEAHFGDQNPNWLGSDKIHSVQELEKKINFLYVEAERRVLALNPQYLPYLAPMLDGKSPEEQAAALTAKANAEKMIADSVVDEVVRRFDYRGAWKVTTVEATAAALSGAFNYVTPVSRGSYEEKLENLLESPEGLSPEMKSAFYYLAGADKRLDPEEAKAFAYLVLLRVRRVLNGEPDLRMRQEDEKLNRDLNQLFAKVKEAREILSGRENALALAKQRLAETDSGSELYGPRKREVDAADQAVTHFRNSREGELLRRFGTEIRRFVREEKFDLGYVRSGRETAILPRSDTEPRV